MSDSLHTRIAQALGWSAKEVCSFSLATLRELVAPNYPKLAHEITLSMQEGPISLSQSDVSWLHQASWDLECPKKGAKHLIIPNFSTPTTEDTMSKEEFEKRFGSAPVNDDLDRVNCPSVGDVGHKMCGVCLTHDKPRFMCGCVHSEGRGFTRPLK